MSMWPKTPCLECKSIVDRKDREIANLRQQLSGVRMQLANAEVAATTKNEEQASSSPEFEPSREACLAMLESLRKHRPKLVEMVKTYPVICSVPGFSKGVCSEVEIAALITSLELRVARTLSH